MTDLRIGGALAILGLWLFEGGPRGRLRVQQHVIGADDTDDFAAVYQGTDGHYWKCVDLGDCKDVDDCAIVDDSHCARHPRRFIDF